MYTLFRTLLEHRFAEIILRLLLLFGIIILLATYLHLSLHAADKVPWITEDDGLATIGASLASHGRFGDPVAPQLNYSGTVRTDDFYIYGVWTFLVEAVLIKIAGATFSVARLVHCVALMIAIVLFFRAFWQRSPGGVGLFIVGTIGSLALWGWEMFRPELIAPALMAATLYSFARAHITNSRPAWFLSAFFAGATATVHPVFALFGLWFVGMWLLSLSSPMFYPGPALPPSVRLRFSHSFLPTLVGGCSSLLIYLTAMGFRIGDLWELSTAYQDIRFQLDYVTSFLIHYNMAWGTYAGAAVLASVMMAIILPVIALYGHKRWRWPTDLLVWSVPASMALLLFHLGLGFYKSHIVSLVFISQVLIVWSATVWFLWAVSIIEIRFPSTIRLGRRIGSLMLVAVLIFVASVIRSPASPLPVLAIAGRKASLARSSVSYDRYVMACLEDLPSGSRVWGNITMGLDVAGEVDLIRIGDGISLAHDFQPPHRSRVAPDFIILNPLYRRHLLRSALSERLPEPGSRPPKLFDLPGTSSTAPDDSHRSFWDTVHRLFPSMRWVPRKLIHAPPYGLTIVFQRQETSMTEHPHAPILVEATDGWSGRWNRVIGKRSTQSQAPLTEPVFFRLFEYDGHLSGMADRSRRLMVKPGFHLIRLRVHRSALHPRTGLFVATPGTLQSEHNDSIIGAAHASIPYQGATETALLVEHHGGPLTISQFDPDPGSDFDITAIHPVSTLAERHWKTLSLPPLASWKSSSTINRLVPVGGESVRLVPTEPDRVGPMKLISPVIAIEPGRRMILNVVGGSNVRLPQINVRDPDSGIWLLRKHPISVAGVFDSGHTRRIVIQVETGAAVNTQPELILDRVRLREDPVPYQTEYAEALVTCRHNVLTNTPTTLCRGARPKHVME
ncbi:MAG: hypothetical protein HQL50_00830 [Magnetococcales bacterium]|nr:hypothetical protein [Magnetococcales bacterium]